MKTLKLFVVLLTFTMIGIACKDKDPMPDYAGDQYANHWIYENMSNFYLWNEHLPAKPAYNVRPDAFFQSLLYKYNEQTNPERDRFSWIVENYTDLINYLNGISNDEIGFEYLLFPVKNSDKLLGEIQYVKQNTPAAQAGLKRGQFFSQINGVTLDGNNYQTLLRNMSGNYHLTVHDLGLKNDTLIVLSEETKYLQTLSQYSEHPVYLDTIYTIGNSKIGYLVYNFFADDENDKSWNYLTELQQALSRFYHQNITDIVLDLRYNQGGSMHAAQWLASMLVHETDVDQIFLSGKYNQLLESAILKQRGPDALNVRFLAQDQNKYNKPAIQFSLPKLGSKLNHLIVLTGSYTASASELLICGLRPYKDVTLLGMTTYGKSVGSTTFYDEDHPENKWGMQPIITRFYNARTETFNVGLDPDYVNADEETFPKLELGDTNENMLNQAINIIITGNSFLRSSKKPEASFYTSKAYSSFATKRGANQAIVDLPPISF